MLKRIKYVSRAPQPLSDAEMDRIGEVSVRNNQRDDITGILVEAAGLFFQVIEGPAEAVDRLYARILADPRHEDVLLLKVMTDVRERLFPDWAMKAVRLAEQDLHTEPIKLLIETAVEARRRVDRLTHGIERMVWSEMAAQDGETRRRTGDVKPR